MTADSQKLPGAHGAGRRLAQKTRPAHTPPRQRRHRAGVASRGSLPARTETRTAGTLTALRRFLDGADGRAMPVAGPEPAAVAATGSASLRQLHSPDRRWLFTRLGRFSDWCVVRLVQAWVTTVRRSSSAYAGLTDDTGSAGHVTPNGPSADGPRERGAVAPAVLTTRAPEDPSFPIDVVYTWVNDRDPEWRARYGEALRDRDPDELAGQSASPARFRNRDELRYSLRSLALNARFVRRVYIVTAGQVPEWLARDVPNVRVVPHEEILEPECLPTFNSHAIETALHRIDGLSEHYLYLNDDFFFGRGCRPSTFFTPDGLPKLFPDRRATVPAGPASPTDRPVDSASKNTRDLMQAEFDLAVAYKMQHIPYPQRRSVVAEMEERFPAVFKQTAHNTFRHHTDVNIASCFSHYYAYATGRAVPAHVPATYINIGNPWASLQMRRLLRRGDSNVFCLNDSPIRFKRDTIVDASVTAFLEEYFPLPSPFERNSVSQAPEGDHVGEPVDRG